MEDSLLQLDIQEEVIFKIDLREVHSLKNMMNLMMAELERLFNEVLSRENHPPNEKVFLHLQHLQRRILIYLILMMTTMQPLLQMERGKELI